MKNLLLLLLLTFTVNAVAAQSVAGKISRLYITSGGVVLFDIEGQCRISNSYDFEFSLSDPYGKELYGFLLTAYTAKRKIGVGYWGDCNGTDRIAPAQLFTAE
jgi:hypothetical protein